MILDTHVWLWFLLDDGNLSISVKNEIDNNPGNFFISSISIWEVCLLAENRQITLSSDSIYDEIRSLVDSVPIKVADINQEIAILSRELKFKHLDPADRFIAATAYAYKLPLVTSDKRLKKLDWLKIIKPR